MFERLGIFRRIVSGEGWALIPPTEDAAHKAPDAPWVPLSENDPASGPIRTPFIEMIKAYQASNEDGFNAAGSQVKAAIEARIPGWSETAHSRITIESRYNRMRPFLAAWIIYLIAALVWIVARAVTQAQGGDDPSPRPKTRAARGWTTAALTVTYFAAACQIAGIAMRCYVAGRPPVTNMYESIIWVSLGQMVFASILYVIHRQGVTLLVSCVLAIVGLIAADSAPAVMDPGLHPLVPVLRSNYWLTIHVLTITLGYAAFALTLGLANVSLWQFFKSDKPGAHVRIASMNQLTYRAMQFGVVLLAAGTILGGIWADYSWGRFWGWDPKEVWALIALLCYLTILHARFTGWVTQFGFAAWSIVAFLSVIMAWYGVNFVLGVGLHSYGFSSGGFAPMATFVGLQLAWVGVVMVIFKRREGCRAGGVAAGGGCRENPVLCKIRHRGLIEGGANATDRGVFAARGVWCWRASCGAGFGCPRFGRLAVVHWRGRPVLRRCPVVPSGRCVFADLGGPVVHSGTFLFSIGEFSTRVLQDRPERCSGFFIWGHALDFVKSVAHVVGQFCYLCTRFKPKYFLDSFNFKYNLFKLE